MEVKEIHKTNPFKEKDIKRVARNLKNNTQVVADKESGELYELVKVNSLTVLTDNRKFTKVYSDSGSTIKDFSVPALRVWCYILQYIKPNKNYIEIDTTECIEFCGYQKSSKASFYSGINELIEKEIIALSTTKSKYWINSNFIFNGNRLKNFVEDINFENE